MVRPCCLFFSVFWASYVKHCSVLIRTYISDDSECQPENVDTDEGSNNELSEGGDDTNAGLGHGSCVDGSEKSSDDEADVGDVGARLSEHPSGMYPETPSHSTRYRAVL